MHHQIIHHTPQNHWKSFPKKSALICFILFYFCVSLTNVIHSRGVYLHFKSKIKVLCLYIKTLCEAMIIDFLMFTSWPFVRSWSLISLCLHPNPLRGNGHWFPFIHQDPLWGNGHWFSYVYIMTFCNTIVIDFLMFTSRPFTRQWSLLLFYTSRPSTRQWLLISLCLHQCPLWHNGHWFPYIYIKTICEAMVIDFLMCTSRPSTRQWLLISLYSHQDHLRGNGHWFLCHFEALYDAMVIDFFTSRPFARQWSLISFLSI